MATPILFASTSETYGKNYDVPLGEQHDRVLGSSWKSKWSYAEAKAIGEFIAYSLWRCAGLPVVTVRLFNTVGPRQTGRYGMVVPRFVDQALTGQDLTVYGDGQQSRCFCHVDDVVPAIAALANSPRRGARRSTSAAAEETTIRDLAERVISLTGSSSGIVHVPYDEAYLPGFEDVRRRVPGHPPGAPAGVVRAPPRSRRHHHVGRRCAPTPDADRANESARTVILFIVVLVLGVNFTLWGAIGLVRIVDDRIFSRRPRRTAAPSSSPASVDVTEVALLIPAHNEELVLGRTVASAAALLPVENIYVVSDGSNDATDAIAGQLGANVLRLEQGRGKASALTAGLETFGLGSRYKVVLLLDADTELSPDYFARGLTQFADPSVVAVAGATTTDWSRRDRSVFTRFLLAHRDRVYLLTQLLQKFGQSWRRTNVVHIVPGAASMYRVEALAQIELEAPGLVIEDFNMTFEVHHRHLGRIAFHPGVRAITQDPDNLRDYTRQVRRWSLGFWQTVRRHGFWPSRFCLALIVTVFELVVSSLFFVTLPLALLAIGRQRADRWRGPRAERAGVVPRRRLRPAAAVGRGRAARLPPDRVRGHRPEATAVPPARRRLRRDAGGGRRRRPLRAPDRVGARIVGEVGEPDPAGVGVRAGRRGLCHRFRCRQRVR